MERRKSKALQIGTQAMGGDAPIPIQSMTNTDSANVEATTQQILALEKAGCEIVRLSIYNEASAAAIRSIKAQIHIPMVADIHFDYRLAIAAIENGIDKLRINPGNIGHEKNVKKLVDCAKQAHIPIRIGVNAGSLKKEIYRRFGGATSEALVESALEHVRILENENFEDIVVSIKASDVMRTVEANRLLAQRIPYPLHIGVTEAGLGQMAMIKSAAGVGALLLDGIGDTVRISITGDPVQEAHAAWNILRALGIRKRGIEIVSCPTCGRTGENDLEAIINEVEARLPDTDRYLKIAIMGCVVNGPGEAAEADMGVAFAADRCVFFLKGERVKTVPREQAIALLIEEATRYLTE